jgi:LPXTG-motif cell wall-anchored protein
MRSRFFMSLLFAVLVSMFAFAFTAGARGTIDARATTTSTGGKASDRTLVFAEGGQAARAQAETKPSGPLAGTTVDTISTDEDGKVEKIKILRPDCTAKEGASLVVEDDDGTQGDLIDDDNVRITEIPNGLKVTSNRAHPDADIKALKVRGGDKVLDNGGLTIVTSTDIEFKGDNPPPETTTTPPPETITTPPPETTTTPPPETTTTPPPETTTTPPPETTTTPPPETTTTPPPETTTTPPPETTTTPPPVTNPTPSASPTPQPQDRVKGPLAGGTAIGKDILVPGDVIDVLPDGTKVVGIDQIVIRTENCKLTSHGDGLSVTLSDQGVPGRITDGQNVDITLKSDGTLVSNGRVELGDFFTTDPRQNPSDRVIVPIPVDPENDQFPREPNDTFPIISSTGIEGEGCHVLEPNNTGNTGSNNGMDNSGNTNSGGSVIPGTTSDGPLPNTGGVPLYVAIIAGLILAGGGVLLYSRSAFQPLSTSARLRSRENGRPPTG